MTPSDKLVYDTIKERGQIGTKELYELFGEPAVRQAIKHLTIQGWIERTRTFKDMRVVWVYQLYAKKPRIEPLIPYRRPSLLQ